MEEEDTPCLQSSGKERKRRVADSELRKRQPEEGNALSPKEPKSAAMAVNYQTGRTSNQEYFRETYLMETQLSPGSSEQPAESKAIVKQNTSEEVVTEVVEQVASRRVEERLSMLEKPARPKSNARGAANRFSTLFKGGAAGPSSFAE